MGSGYDQLFNMHGKVVFVAGGSGAIGSEMARVMAHYGGRIAIAGIALDDCRRTILLQQGRKRWLWRWTSKMRAQ